MGVGLQCLCQTKKSNAHCWVADLFILENLRKGA